MARSRSFNDLVIWLKMPVNCPTSSRVVGSTEVVRSPSVTRLATAARLRSGVIIRPASRIVVTIPPMMMAMVSRTMFQITAFKSCRILSSVTPTCTTPSALASDWVVA